MQCACGHTDDPNTQAGMHKGFVKERPFKRWHAAIFSSLAVEDYICGDDGAADDGGAIEQPLSHAAGVRARDLATRLHVGPMEGMLEGIARFGERSDGRSSL